ncbi:M28 family peptidase [Pelomyxa schiedti]|nr:M28 family peptidase [Pelomyxa schiedti]
MSSDIPLVEHKGAWSKEPSSVSWRGRCTRRKVAFASVVAFAVVVLVIIALVLVAVRNKNDDVHLDEDINVDNIVEELGQLEDIAEQYGNCRTDFSGGYEASLEYLEEQLAGSGLIVWRSPVFFSLRMLNTTSALKMSLVSPVKVDFIRNTDWRILGGSISSNVYGAPLCNVSGPGCTDADYTGCPNGAVAVITDPLNVCSWSEKVAVAVNNSAAMIMGYSTDYPTSPPRYYFSAYNHPIPGITVTGNLAQMLLAYGVSATVNVEFLIETTIVFTENLIAETPTGNSDNIVTVGAHLDSTSEGPGINDNGSGSMTLLELALVVSRTKMSDWIKNKIQFMWWAAEEYGLVGSVLYLQYLNATDRAKIVCNLNMDMTGSPNYILEIINGSTVTQPTAQYGSIQIQKLYSDYLESQDFHYKLINTHGASDYYPFNYYGIPANSIAGGAGELKTADDRDLFGGVCNVAADPCYHQVCDTMDNFSTECLELIAKANAHVTQELAQNENVRDLLFGGAAQTQQQQPIDLQDFLDTVAQNNKHYSILSIEPLHINTTPNSTTQGAATATAAAATATATANNNNVATQRQAQRYATVQYSDLVTSRSTQQFLESLHTLIYTDIDKFLHPQVTPTQPNADDVIKQKAALLAQSSSCAQQLQRGGWVLSAELLSAVTSQRIRPSTKAAAAAIISDVMWLNADKYQDEANTSRAEMLSLDDEAAIHQKLLKDAKDEEEALEAQLRLVKLKKAQEQGKCEELRRLSLQAKAKNEVLTAKEKLFRAEHQGTEETLRGVIEAIGALQSKIRASKLEDLTCSDVAMLLRELGLSQHCEAFENIPCNGPTLELIVNENNWEDTGITDIMERKLLSYSVWLISSSGRIRAPIPSDLTASVLGTEDTSLLQLPSFSGPQLEQWLRVCHLADKFSSVPGYAFLEMTGTDLKRLGIDLPLCPPVTRLIKATRVSLAQAFVVTSMRESSVALENKRIPPQWQCALTGRQMQNPVIAKDGFVYDSSTVPPEESTHSPLTYEEWTPSSILPWTCITWKKLLDNRRL